MLIEFPRNEEAYSYYEVLTTSLESLHICYGDILECYPEDHIQDNAIYAVLLCGHLCFRYLYERGRKISLVPASHELPIILAPASQATIIGRITRYYHAGQWRPVERITQGYWIHWPFEEAS
jgi:SOS-response transcriptional repressor LexA